MYSLYAFLTFAATALAPALACADSATEPHTTIGHTTELAAVIAATSSHNAISIREDREFMGAILHHHGRYTFTVGAGKPGQDEIAVRIRLPRGAVVVAFWHTHGARAPSNRYFSAVDTALVEEWSKPLYLADYTGQLKVMRPGDTRLSAAQARRLGLPARAGFAIGQRVTNSQGQRVKVARRLPP